MKIVVGRHHTVGVLHKTVLVVLEVGLRRAEVHGLWGSGVNQGFFTNDIYTCTVSDDFVIIPIPLEHYTI